MQYADQVQFTKHSLIDHLKSMRVS